VPPSDKGVIQNATSGGVSGQHAAAPPFQILAAPSTEDQFNKIQLPLTVLACWGVDDVRFAFDSSFLDVDYDGAKDPPEDIRQELVSLKSLMDANKGSPLSLFGHADPVGDDVYNKSLSERRARSVYALLIFKSEPDLAVQYWNSIASQEHWGTNQQGTMQSFTGGSASGSSLIRAYLQKLSDPGPTLSKTDFLGQGAGTDRKGDFQGCSEFNPLLIFSQEKQAEFDQAKANNDEDGIRRRNRQNAPNRRVLGLIFDSTSKINSSKWPCPRASEGIAGCVNQFWYGGDARRNRHDAGQDRLYTDKHDTFACRFYQRLAGDSPCDVVTTSVRLRLFDRYSTRLAKAPYVVQLAGRTQTGFADANGEVLLRDISLGSTCVVLWSRYSESLDTAAPAATWTDYEFRHTVSIDLDTPGTVPTFSDTPLPAGPDSHRLNNLGYIFKETPSLNISAFQQDAGLTPSGTLSSESKDKVRNQHDILITPPPRSDQADTMGDEE
jgi:hypothetical protein